MYDHTHEDDGGERHYQRTADEVDSASEASAGSLAGTNHVGSDEAAQGTERVDEPDRCSGRSAAEEGGRQAPKRWFSSADTEGSERETRDRQNGGGTGAGDDAHSDGGDETGEGGVPVALAGAVGVARPEDH